MRQTLGCLAVSLGVLLLAGGGCGDSNPNTGMPDLAVPPDLTEIVPDLTTTVGGDAASAPDLTALADLSFIEDLSLPPDIVAGPDLTPVCDPQSCATGCCAGNPCTAPSVMACGSGGKACTACDPRLADTCTNGACACGSG